MDEIISGANLERFKLIFRNLFLIIYFEKYLDVVSGKIGGLNHMRFEKCCELLEEYARQTLYEDDEYWNCVKFHHDEYTENFSIIEGYITLFDDKIFKVLMHTGYRNIKRVDFINDQLVDFGSLI